MSKRLLILLFLSTICYGSNFWGYPIYILDEAKNAACAMEMEQRSDWIVPTFNNDLRTDKPPLHYFFMMVAYKIFGVNPFSARFFSVVMGILTVLVLYFFVKIIVDEPTAFFSSLIVISSLQMMIQFHLAVPDPYLIFFITLGCLSFFYAYQGGRSLFYYLFYFSIAMAFMAKGPVAIVLPGLSIMIYLILKGEFSIKMFSRIHFWSGVLLFLLLVAPWWLAIAIKTNGEWLHGFLFDHNLNRFASTMEGHKSIPGLALVIVFAALLPLSVFLPQAIIMSWRDRVKSPFLLYCIVICLVFIVFFSVSRTILPSYPAPCVPFGAVLLGYFINQILVTKQKFSGSGASGFFLLILSLALPIAGYVLLNNDPLVSDLKNLSIFLTVLTLGAMIGFIFLVRNEVLKAIYSYLGSYLIASLLLLYLVMPRLMIKNPVSQSLPSILTSLKPIVTYKQTNAAFTFNLKRPIENIESLEELGFMLKKNPHLIILTRETHRQDLEQFGFKVVQKEKDLFENPTTVVLEN
jgi:4-amino-4-deoxy-L-arabinose transferase-like glycosyltransferase